METKHVHHISHIDLDGYSCSYLVDGLWDNSDNDRLVQSNVDYHELTDHLARVLGEVDDSQPLDLLLITDLNLKPKDISVLLTYKHRFKQLVLIDHHRTDLESLGRLDALSHVDLYITQGTSATKLTYDWLVRKEAIDVKENELELGAIELLVEYVNTYDIYLVDHPTFEKAYFLNEWFMKRLNAAKSVLSPYGVLRYALASLDTVMERIFFYANRGDINLSTQWDMEDQLRRITDEHSDLGLMSYGLVTSDDVKLFRDHADRLAASSRDALLVALCAIGPLGVAGSSVHDTTSGRVLISEVPLPRDVLYHLMYTVCHIDQYVVQQHPKRGKIEFRQHATKPYVNLSKLASEYGGGGHIGAAGCHYTGEWSTLERFVLAWMNHQSQEAPV